MKNNLVQVELPRPINMEFNKSKNYGEGGKNKFDSILIEGFKCYYINSGAKHIVIKFNDDILFEDDLKLEKILKKIRYNKLFLPDGVNVNIYRYKAVDTIQVKTYEKGVEAMMTSCSSGSYACAYHYYHCYEKYDRIKILNDGGTSEAIFKDNKNLFLSKGEIEYKGELDI
jgi:diaminopimelate epimerase